MIRIFSAAVFLFAGFAVSAREEYAIIAREKINTAGLSPLGQQVMGASSGIFASNEAMVVHAATLPEVARILDEADYARAQMKKLFGHDFMSGAESFFVFSISDSNVWRQILREHGLRRDGLAMRLQREIYFDNRSGQDIRPDRIMHEMVHMVIGETYPDLPYWLDEGLAGYLGWLFTSRYQAGNNLALVRHFPALDGRDLYSFEELISLKVYPTTAKRVAAFYRQSELLVQYLIEQRGVDAVKRIMDLAGIQKDDPVSAFRSVYGMDPDEEHAIFSHIKGKILTIDSNAK